MYEWDKKVPAPAVKVSGHSMYGCEKFCGQQHSPGALSRWRIPRRHTCSSIQWNGPSSPWWWNKILLVSAKSYNKFFSAD